MSSGRGNPAHVIHPIDDQHCIDLGLTDKGLPVIIISYQEAPGVQWVSLRIEAGNRASFFVEDELIEQGTWQGMGTETLRDYVRDLVEDEKLELYIALNEAVDAGRLTSDQSRSIRRHVQNTFGFKLEKPDAVLQRTLEHK